MNLLISISSFFIVMVVVALISGLFDKNRESVEERLVRYVGQGKKISLYHAEMEESIWKRLSKPLIENLIKLMADLAPEQWKKQLEEKIFKAGHPLGLTTDQFIMLQIFLIFGLPFMVTLGLAGFNLKKALSVGALMMVCGLIFPEYMLRVQIRKRTAEIQEKLPDMLDLLTVSVEAGLGFDAAMNRVVEKTSGHLTMEFKRLLQEIRMGKPRLEAFRDLSERSISPDLHTFCTAIIQADQLGVSIGQVLRIQSEEMRTRRKQRAEEAAMKAPIKMLFPLIMLIFPALFIILLGPAVIRLIEIIGGM